MAMSARLVLLLVAAFAGLCPSPVLANLDGSRLFFTRPSDFISGLFAIDETDPAFKILPTSRQDGILKTALSQTESCTPGNTFGAPVCLAQLKQLETRLREIGALSNLYGLAHNQ
jgi:hypothetical protein